jgi:group I intron endonuclease
MIIYQIRCLINNKVYIGKTNNLEKRWKGHLSLSKTGKGYLLHKAIRKYGIENFEINILKENASDEDEKILIKEYRHNSYNIHIGGKGGDNITFHPDKKEIFLKRRVKHEQNVRRNSSHPKWVIIDENIKSQIVQQYFSYELPSPVSICNTFNIKKDVFNRIIREKHTLYRSLIERFCYNENNIKQLIFEHISYTIQDIRKRGCGLGTDSIAVVLKRNSCKINKGPKNDKNWD